MFLPGFVLTWHCCSVDYWCSSMHPHQFWHFPSSAGTFLFCQVFCVQYSFLWVKLLYSRDMGDRFKSRVFGIINVVYRALLPLLILVHWDQVTNLWKERERRGGGAGVICWWFMVECGFRHLYALFVLLANFVFRFCTTLLCFRPVSFDLCIDFLWICNLKRNWWFV